LIGCFGCAGSVDFSDSDEEDENIAGISDSNGGLSSFPVDSWEDTWDDSVGSCLARGEIQFASTDLVLMSLAEVLLTETI